MPFYYTPEGKGRPLWSHSNTYQERALHGLDCPTSRAGAERRWRTARALADAIRPPLGPGVRPLSLGEVRRSEGHSADRSNGNRDAAIPASATALRKLIQPAERFVVLSQTCMHESHAIGRDIPGFCSPCQTPVAIALVDKPRSDYGAWTTRHPGMPAAIADSHATDSGPELPRLRASVHDPAGTGESGVGTDFRTSARRIMNWCSDRLGAWRWEAWQASEKGWDVNVSTLQEYSIEEFQVRLTL